MWLLFKQQHTEGQSSHIHLSKQQADEEREIHQTPFKKLSILYVGELKETL